ncbi:MAG: DUF6531 domain-containing protein, partial [Clostridiales Family XIII bacterium]|nr:DUF6531 domain-containing protein [Clostridiales Family XIII bacterium]
MSVARSRASATEFGGKVYIFGGATGDGVTDLVEMLDPGWDDKIELPVPLKDFESVMLAGKLYIIGGKKLSGGAAVSSRAVYAYDPVTKAISSKAQLPADFYYISAAAAYGKIYLIGSPSASSTTKSLYEYSPGRNQWTLAASIDTVKSGVTEAVFWNERIYMITAYSSTLRTVVTYDPITEQVVSKPNITLSRSSTYKANAIVYGGELYLMSTKTNTYLKCTNTGGTDSWSAGTWDLQSYPSTVLLGGSLYSFPDRALSARDLYYKYSIAEGMNATKCTFYDYKKIINAAAWNNKAFMFVNADSGEYATHFTVYTPPEGIWQDFSQLSAAKSAPGSAFLGGYIYAAGGYSESGGYYSTMDRFSPGETGSTARASMANARSNLALLAAGSKIYAIGGKNAGARALTYVEEYNPATNTWQNRAAIPAATANMASAVYNGNIYIFGGNDASKTALSTVRMYNPTTNIWTTKASMPKALYGAGAGTIGDKIYVAGGFTAGDDTEPKTASKILYVYDPVNNTWDSTKQAMPSPLGFAGSVSETNLYMAGGTDGTNEIALVHEYSPTLNKWFTWDGPKITSYLNAAVITDGNLFVFGGQNMSEYFSQAEYAPIDSFTESYLHLGDETVNLSGNFARNYVDMEYKAPGFNVVFGRTYNSHDGRGTSEGNVIGMGWSFSFQGSIDVSGNDAVVRVPNGSGYIFAQDTVTGEYTAKDSRMTLVKDGDNHIMTSPDQYTYEFNNKGKLFRMKDPYGNAITLTIDTLGRVSGVTDQVGRVSEIHYNSMGRISSIYDPAGRQIIYTYNDAGQLIRTVGPTTSYHRYYHYDDAIGGYLSAVTDTTGITIEAISYEMPTGKKVPMVKSIKDINGRIATYSYDNATGMVKETDQNGNESSTWYDRAIYPVHTKDAEGRETHTEYYKDGAVNRYGEVHTFTDKYGSTTSYERDENGNVTRVINPDNSVKGYKYNDK